jgi:hypothetical protein
MTDRILSRTEQWAQREVSARLSARLELRLMSLVRSILDGDVGKLVTFQQLIQLAPPEMKERVENFIQSLRTKGDQ